MQCRDNLNVISYEIKVTRLNYADPWLQEAWVQTTRFIDRNHIFSQAPLETSQSESAPAGKKKRSLACQAPIQWNAVENAVKLGAGFVGSHGFLCLSIMGAHLF